MGSIYVTDNVDFYKGNDPKELIKMFGSPLYVYSEDILEQRCRDMLGLCGYKNFRVNYSAKANSNLFLLQIIQRMGLDVEAMGPGEMELELKAGFSPKQIFFISNNVSKEEMKFAIDRDILLSVDSLSQLEQFGSINQGGRVAVRINPGIGAGHHKKVVTGGKNTKFAIDSEKLDIVVEILKKYNLKLAGINHHIGSLFMDGEVYLRAMDMILSFAKRFNDSGFSIDFIDLGGGFGIPYKKQEGEQRLDLASLRTRLDKGISDFIDQYGKEITLKVEPGRYIVAECGVLLGCVHSIKDNNGTKYIGTDIGFNVLIRPSLYNSHHDIEVYSHHDFNIERKEIATVVGNICETGDILAKDRELPKTFIGDVIGVMDAGAYGFSMSSNYNGRLRPAEVLIEKSGNVKLIRRRDTLKDLLAPYENL